MTAQPYDHIILPCFEVDRAQRNIALYSMGIGAMLMFGLGLTLHDNLMDRQARMYQQKIDEQGKQLGEIKANSGKFVVWTGKEFIYYLPGRK